MATKKIKHRPFDRGELEAKAIANENLSHNMRLTASSRAYFRKKAKSLRRLLEVTDLLWGKPKTSKKSTTVK